MSTTPQQPLVSPHAYVQQQFGEACEELGVNPQDTVLLLLFDFLRTTPENRGGQVANLKKAFNNFCEAGDFEKLQKTIDAAVNTVELQLYDSLADDWDDQKSD